MPTDRPSDAAPLVSLPREPMVHDLKVWPEFFAALWDGVKSFEWRKHDRDYQVGDALILREWDPGTGTYTGRGTKRTIAYILRGRFGVPDGFAVLGFAALSVERSEPVDDDQASRVAHAIMLGAEGLPPRDYQRLARAYLASPTGDREQDGARLDWLERDHNAKVYPTMLDGDFGVLVEHEEGKGFSLNGKVREAIDAARGTE